MSQPPITIDIVSDVVCPWCVVGHGALSRAIIEVGLAGGPDAARVRFRPFELNPWMPEEGQDLREHLRMKYGTTPTQSRANRDRLTRMGAEYGFTFRFSEGSRMVNTFRAHQLIHWAYDVGAGDGRPDLGTDTKLALFEAHFTRGEDVNHVPTLASVAARVGLDADEAAAVLYDARFADMVREEQETWRDKGIHAVPSVVIDNRMLLTGAQDPGTFVRALERAVDAREEAVVTEAAS